VIPVTRQNGAVSLPVYVQPGSSRERVVGEHDGRLKLAVAAPPERGQANAAVCRLLARELGLRKGSVRVVAGRTSRLKEVLIERVTPDALDAIIA
jgi:uncharacterized protein (TIGR00251 family)